jgi:hypothetical protein
MTTRNHGSASIKRTLKSRERGISCPGRVVAMIKSRSVRHVTGADASGSVMLLGSLRGLDHSHGSGAGEWARFTVCMPI